MGMYERQLTLLGIGDAHRAAAAQVLLYGPGRNPNPEFSFHLIAISVGTEVIAEAVRAAAVNSSI